MATAASPTPYAGGTIGGWRRFSSNDEEWVSSEAAKNQSPTIDALVTNMMTPLTAGRCAHRFPGTIVGVIGNSGVRQSLCILERGRVASALSSTD